MPVRCPACHSDQTKPAPARNLWEQLTGLLGRRAYFCEDCYRRFTPSKSGQPTPESEAQPAPEASAATPARPAPSASGAEEVAELSMAISAQEGLPTPASPQGQPPEAAPAPDEESMVTRMRRQMSEETPAEEAQAGPEQTKPRQAWPLSPARLAWIGGGVVLAMALVLWYRSSLDRPPQPPQAPTTRVKISEPAVAPPAASAPMPASEAAPPQERPSPRTEPAPRAMEPPRALEPPRAAEPAPRTASRPPAPKPAATPTKAAQPKASPKTASAPSRPSPGQGNYAVQFGAFSQASRAQALAAKLQAKGVKVQVQSGKARDGKVWHKVRSTGLPTQAEAQRVQRKLEQVSGVKGMVVRIKP